MVTHARMRVIKVTGKLDSHELAGVFHYKLKNAINFPAFFDEATVNLVGNAFPIQTTAVLVLGQKFIDHGWFQIHILGKIIDFSLTFLFFKFTVCFIKVGFLVKDW